MAAPRVLRVLATGPGVVQGGGQGVSPLDLALLRGEAVFETMRAYQGRPFRLGAHLDRLAASAAALQITLPHGLDELVGEAAGACDGGDGVIRLVCTRGTEAELVSSAFAVVTEVPGEHEEARRRGLRIALLTLAVDPLVRAAAPWLLAGAKTTSYAVNMAAQRAAQARGADDAVFVGLGGELLEAPTATVWWRSGQVLYTPALDLGILAGVTRGALVELAPRAGYRVVEGVFSADDLVAADEAFMTSTVREVMPVVGVDGVRIGDGRPGSAAAALQTALRETARSAGG
ncbi:MAG TPA: aminotransferase class IV [Actinomycetes bacterium]|nr:aminotransferase class IV [Actinomycetes bacterium]